MPSYIKRVTAQKCPVHQAILEECGKRLVEKGYFNKQHILEALNFIAMEESIRWDYLATFLSDPQGLYRVELVPLAQRFFNSTKTERQRTEHASLGRFTAGGHGKKTAGYASVAFEGGRLAVKRAEKFGSIRNGTSTAFDNYVKAVLQQNKKLSKENRGRLRAI